MAWSSFLGLSAKIAFEAVSWNWRIIFIVIAGTLLSSEGLKYTLNGWHVQFGWLFMYDLWVWNVYLDLHQRYMNMQEIHWNCKLKRTHTVRVLKGKTRGDCTEKIHKTRWNQVYYALCYWVQRYGQHSYYSLFKYCIGNEALHIFHKHSEAHIFCA